MRKFLFRGDLQKRESQNNNQQTQTNKNYPTLETLFKEDQEISQNLNKNEKIVSLKGDFNRLRKNVFAYLFTFFSYKEALKIAKTNHLFYIHFKCSIEKAVNNFERCLEEYGLTVLENKKYALFKSIKNKIIYITSNQGEFVIFKCNGIEKYSQSYYSNWAWKNDGKYWKTLRLSSSLNCPSPFLQTVCFADVNFSFHQVKKGDYILYLRQAFTYLLESQFILTVKLNDVVIYKDEHYPSKELIKQACFNNEKDIILQKQYICEITENSFINQSTNNNTVTIYINNIDLFWKGGWCIDGGVLEENKNLLY